MPKYDLGLVKGPQGDTGLRGPQGLQGAQGPKGDTGAQGAQGLRGELGPVGPQGIQGLKGETGAQGPQGLKGNTGPTGPQGIQGAKGAAGAVGAQGAQGIQGPKGDQGERGLQGPKGAVGASGKSAYVAAAESGYTGDEAAFNGALAQLPPHVASRSNPHGVTAAQVGADPAGSAAAAQGGLNAHAGRRDNPHGVTAAQLGAVSAAGKASVGEAQAGADDTKWMTPARTKNAFDSFLGSTALLGYELLATVPYTSLTSNSNGTINLANGANRYRFLVFASTLLADGAASIRFLGEPMNLYSWFMRMQLRTSVASPAGTGGIIFPLPDGQVFSVNVESYESQSIIVSDVRGGRGFANITTNINYNIDGNQTTPLRSGELKIWGVR